MAATLTDTLESVELADGVQIHLRVAGPAVRSVAWLLDLLLFFGILMIVQIAVGLVGGLAGDQVGKGLMLLFAFLLNWFYNVFFEMGSRAATPGQRKMGLRVASVNGGPVTLPQSMTRNILRVVDFMPAGYLFGLVCTLCTSRFQRLGDLVADTVVIYVDREVPFLRSPSQLNADPVPPAVALTREEQAAFLQFIERSPQWSEDRRIELTNLLQPLTQRLGMAGLLSAVQTGLWLQTGGSSQRQAENDHGETWERLEQMVAEMEKSQRSVAGAEEMPTLFRQVCHDLSLAQHRMFGRKILDRLNGLAIAGYRMLERRAGGGWERLWQLMTRDFPRAVRAESRLFWFCSAVFWLPFIFFVAVTPIDPDWSMSMLGSEGMINMEEMYGPETSPLKHMREEYGSDFGMFCFYIWNNVSINLRTFAGGLLGGVGSLVILLFNGASIGAATGYVNHACNPATFYTFVVGHGAPELLGIVISGMAGMRLGLSLVKPGPYDRRTALVIGGRKAFLLITGAALMTSFAAVLEGFWSANPFEPWIKYTVGACMWTATICYLLFSGKERHAA